MSAHEFTISVSDLDAGGKDHNFPVRAAWIRGAFEGQEATTSGNEGKLALRASKSGNDVVVHGTLDAELSLPCARCLERFALPVHADVSVLFVPRNKLQAPKGAASEDGHDLTDEEADTLPYDGETVVLDDLVRDELVLELPMIPLCREACPGMSPGPETGQVAANRSEDKGIDPRLAPLLQFRKGMNKE